MESVQCPLCKYEWDPRTGMTEPLVDHNGECSVCYERFCVECESHGGRLICEQCHALVCPEHAVEIEGETHCPKCAKIAWEREAA